MRILMLAQFYPPIVGGEERHVQNLSIELAARGHDVAVATLWHEGMPEFECNQGVRIYRIHGSLQRVTTLFIEKGRQHAPPFPDPEIMWALRRIIAHERPDIVHAHNWLVHSFLPLKAWSKAKLVVTLHDCSLVCAQKRFFYHETTCTGPALTKCLECSANYYGVAKGVPITLANWVGKKIELRTVDMFLPVSRAIAEIAQLSTHNAPYQVVPNFVSDDIDVLCDDTHPLLAQLPKDNYLLFVGDLGRDKGVEVLLRAHAELGSQIPLVLIGRPVVGFPTSVPSNVHILQSLPHNVIMSAWSRCSLGLMPSICLDACPTVAMEAMAMGRPIIASRIGGLLDIVVDGETGFLVTPGDWRALYQAIQRLLSDPTLRARMGIQAKKRIARFQISSVLPRIEQIYQEVVQS
ncbi:MAG: hypothetical protein NVS4B12_04990 [Ktedonobacteraceae bacterium]